MDGKDHVDLLYEHPSGIKVVSKPAPMDTLGYDDIPVPRLYSMMKAKLADEMGENDRLHLKRIDRFTSGIQIIGINKFASGFFSKYWHSEVHKSYLAITEKPRWTQVDISMPIGGKHCRTGLDVLQTNQAGFAVIHAKLLEYGRTHQIRKVLKFLDATIVGDFYYRGTRLPMDFRQGQMLHAWRVEFPIPTPDGDIDKIVQVQAPVPDDYRILFDFDWDAVDADATPIIKSWEVDEDAFTFSEPEDRELGHAADSGERS